MSSFLVYLILILDNIRMFLIVTEITCGVYLFLYLIVSSVSLEEDLGDIPEKIRNLCKPIITVFVLCILSCIFIPDTKQAAVIYLIPKISQNEQIQNISEQSLNILELKVEEYFNELKKDLEK